VQLNVLVRADLKRMIARAAKQSDRTLSAEAELWLERLLAYENLMKAFASLQSGKGAGLREAFTKILTQGGPGDDEGSK
jgi:hypothetical protein